MGTIKGVIDTNVAISALLFGGIPGQLIPLWQSGKIKPAASKIIIDEYLRVLTYPKFKLSEEEIKFILYQEILPYFDVVEIQTASRIVKKDPADDIFVNCATAANAKYIISGDRHLLELKAYKKIKILSPAVFIEKLR